jgi:hypothetical protein
MRFFPRRYKKMWHCFVDQVEIYVMLAGGNDLYQLDNVKITKLLTTF